MSQAGGGRGPEPGGAGPAPVRLVSAWVPDWPVAALSLDPHGRAHGVPEPSLAPVAVSEGNLVLAASPLARRAGVRRGQRVRVARGLCPALTVVPSSSEREERAFQALVDAAGQVLVEVRVLRPGVLVAEADGSSRWWGGEEEVAACLAEEIAVRTGAECQVGIADSLLTAVLAAREGVIVPPGRSAAFLAPRPLEDVLQALTSRRTRQEAQELLGTLERLGVTTLGALADLGEQAVRDRFGPVGEHLLALASARSRWLPVAGNRPGDEEATVVLDPPAERSDAVSFAARGLAEELARRLVRAGMSAGRVVVEVSCEDGTVLSRSWLMDAVPTPEDLTDRVRWQVEGWLSGQAPGCALVRLTLRACDLVPAGTQQEGLWYAPGEQDSQRALRAARRLDSLLGAGSVKVVRLVEGRDPRSRALLVPWEAAPAGRSAPGAAAREAGAGGARAPLPWVGSLPAPSPALVLERPVPVDVRGERGEPVEVSGQGFLEGVPLLVVLPARLPPVLDGQEWWRGRAEEGVRIASWAGPWPVEEGWWREQGASRRAYLQVVTQDGPPLLLVRSGRWWLDAVYS